ncbi:hypothetical protein CGLO_17609 [Colletotrichum gloeosporioides Cg-14]|uniref:Uncharacterized protein n=1 Tax=Colletotrichum gloeosporioides (strain Cg-14) TaxID=1237896 RepID=T0JWE9_COLGC|nr:hypothetical protein CGLO_17609 [Colletotrichum gloeosporioides Cg-14]
MYQYCFKKRPFRENAS